MLQRIKKAKKRLYRGLMLLMIGFMSLTNMTLPTQAAMVSVSIQTIPGHPYRGTGPGHGQYIERHDSNAEILTVNGQRVFCIEPWAIITNGASMTEGDLTAILNNDIVLQNTLSKIGYYGYWQSNRTVEDYMTTQIMIWEARGWTFSQVPGYYASKKAEIQNRMSSHSRKLSFNNAHQQVKLGETVKLTDTNGVLSRYMNSAGYPSQNHTYSSKGFNFYWSGNDLYMTPTTDADDYVSFNFSNISSADEGTNVVYYNGNNQKTSPLVKLQDPAYSNFSFDVLKYGKLEIGKQDEDGIFVPNTQFKISYNADMSDPIGTYTTGIDGKVLIEELLPQSVYVQEVSVPAHLVLDSTIHETTIRPNETTGFTANNNWKKQKVRIVKHDAKSNKVVKRAGITYDIYSNYDGTKVTTITSDENGVAESGLLKYGDYYWIERKAPTKYLVDKDRHYFTINKNHTEQEFVSKTASDIGVTAKSTITKEDKETGATPQGDATLEGAVYGFYAAEDIYDPANDGTIKYHKDQLVSTHTIKNGKATATVEYLGKYYWLEDQDKASKGYLPDLEKHYVNLIYKDQETPVVVANALSGEQVKKQAFQIEKLESSGTSGELPPLSGAEFTYILKSYVDKYGSFEEAVKIAEANDGRIKSSEWGRMVTDDNGYAKSKELPYGKYVVKETVVPKDHNAVDDFTIVINDDSRTPLRMRFFEDKTMSTKLAVVKVDEETGNKIALSNMRFRVKALTKTADFEAGDYVGYWAWNPLPHYVNEWTTSEDGTVMLEMSLKAGTYQIEEFEAPDGYLKNHEPLVFTITGGWHQQVGPDDITLITTVSFEDEPVKGQVQIDKQAELFKGYQSEMTKYGELFTPIYEKGLLPGVKFTITAKTDIIGMDGTVWYHAGDTVETLVSDGKELTTSSLLPIGSDGNNIYSLQEVATAEGYVLDSTVHDFRFDYVDEETAVVAPTWLDENGKEIEAESTITLDNEKQTALAVTSKVMETSIFDHEDAYKNVMFGVYSDEVDGLQADSLVALSPVDDKGNLNASLSQSGTYYLKEVATDNYYVLDDNRYPFNFEYNGDKVQKITVNDGLIMNDLKRASIEVIKYTNENVYYSKAEQQAIEDMGEDMSEYMRNDLLKDERNYLAFSEFELATDKAFENIVQTGTTDINGRLVFENLELGTYYVREKDSAEFYEINDEIFEVTLSKKDQFETVEVQNDLMESHVDIKKVDADDHNKTLVNAGFTMYADEECTKEIETVKTDKTGIARFDGIKFGTTIYIKETSAPVGYELSDEVVEVTIDENWVDGDDVTRVVTYVDHKVPEKPSPDTGSNVTPWMYIAMLGISACVSMMLKKKKEEAE